MEEEVQQEQYLRRREGNDVLKEEGFPMGKVESFNILQAAKYLDTADDFDS